MFMVSRGLSVFMKESMLDKVVLLRCGVLVGVDGFSIGDEYCGSYLWIW